MYAKSSSRVSERQTGQRQSGRRSDKSVTQPANGQNRRIVEFQDNRIAALVYGQHDSHLARLESQLGVVIINRGNRVAVEGLENRTDRAVNILNELYAMAERGRALDLGDVDGAVRMSDDARTGNGRGLGIRTGTNPSDLKIITRNKTITPRSPGQVDYIGKLATSDMVFGIGPAGTGKTYLAVAMGVARMLSGEIDRIVLSRPAVEAGESLGFLPGDMKEKVDPYLRPLYDALYDMMPAEQVEKRLETGQIEIAPLAFMRGRTLSNACIILDEAQNTTAMQMKMFLTRFGENSRMVICGDISQIDLPPGTKSGLVDALDTVVGLKGIGITRFKSEDVVRHPLVARIVDAYDRAEGKTSDKRRTPRTTDGATDSNTNNDKNTD